MDVRDLEGLRDSIKGDIIINLAAEHRDDVRPRSLYWEVNVDGAKNVCQVAQEKGIDKIIFTSSVAVYGFTHKETYEDGELRPFNEYGITKLEAEKYIAFNPLSRWNKPPIKAPLYHFVGGVDEGGGQNRHQTDKVMFLPMQPRDKYPAILRMCNSPPFMRR